jgi:hypothetical protein
MWLERRASSQNTSTMVDILNLALPYFGLIFIAFALSRRSMFTCRSRSTT